MIHFHISHFSQKHFRVLTATIASSQKCFQLLQSLEAMKFTDGTNLLGLETYLKELASAGIQLKRLPTLGPSYFKTSVQQPYLTNLIKNLTTRFEDKSIITAFDLFNPNSIPSDPSEFVKFGNENVRKLSEHYQSSGILNGIDNCFQNGAVVSS